MQLEGAVIKEQGVTFAVVVVKPQVTQNSLEARRAIAAFSGAFDGLPVVLMSQDRGRARFYGRPDLAKFLASVPVHCIPWRKYTMS